MNGRHHHTTAVWNEGSEPKILSRICLPQLVKQTNDVTSHPSFFFYHWEQPQSVLLCVSCIVFPCHRPLGLPLSEDRHRGWGCSSVGRASDRHVANAGSIPRCGKGFFSQSAFSADSLTVFVHPRVQSHAFTSGTCSRSRSPCQKSVDYENTETPNMHPRLGSATLLQLAFPGETNPKFPWEKSHCWTIPL